MSAFNSFKYYRELLGLSQEELAMYLQVNRNTLAKAENNERELPTSTYLRLMELALSSHLQITDILCTFEHVTNIIPPFRRKNNLRRGTQK
jgi:transcriptional regulator with XRE-family HTH domain